MTEIQCLFNGIYRDSLVNGVSRCDVSFLWSAMTKNQCSHNWNPKISFLTQYTHIHPKRNQTNWPQRTIAISASSADLYRMELRYGYCKLCCKLTVSEFYQRTTTATNFVASFNMTNALLGGIMHCSSWVSPYFSDIWEFIVEWK